MGYVGYVVRKGWMMIGEILESMARAVVSRYMAMLPLYPTVRAERGEGHDVVLVWGEKVPTEFSFRVSQAAYARFIGHKLTADLLCRMSSYANELILRCVNRGDLMRVGLEWRIGLFWDGVVDPFEVPWAYEGFRWGGEWKKTS